MIITNDSFQSAFDILSKADSVAVDLETNSINPYISDPLIVGISMSTGTHNFYFPLGHVLGENLDDLRIQGLRVLLSMPTPQIYWNCLFDMQWLRMNGYRHGTRIRDAMLALHLLDENRQMYTLKGTAKEMLNVEDEEAKLDLKLAELGLSKDQMWKLAPEDVAPYAEMDAYLTHALAAQFARSLRAAELYSVWTSVCDYAVALSYVEQRGLKVDVEQCQRRIEEANDEYQRVLKLLQGKHGSDFNPNSPKKVQAALDIKGTTNEERMQQLVDDGNKDAYLILTARRWTKVRSTYYEPFLQYMDKDNILHPNIKVHGTITGRLSCSNPNLMAIPRDGEISEYNEPLPKSFVKSVFVARDGYDLVQYDYKQAEVYVATHYARAQNMRRYLVDGLDIHQQTAEAIGHPRDFAKRVNFSIIYGIGAKALAHDLGIPVMQAQQVLTDYVKIHPEFTELYRQMETHARQNQQIRLFTGRRIRYDTRMYHDWHKASSNLVQGTVAEIIRIAVTKIHNDFYSDGVYQCLQVHDSNLVEIPEDKHYLIPAVGRAMTYTNDVYPFWIPLKVDIEIGKRWYDVDQYTQEYSNG